MEYTLNLIPVNIRTTVLKSTQSVIISLKHVLSDLAINQQLLLVTKNNPNLLGISNNYGNPMYIRTGSSVTVAKSLAIANVLDFEECLDMSDILQHEKIIEDNNAIMLTYE